MNTDWMPVEVGLALACDEVRKLGLLNFALHLDITTSTFAIASGLSQYMLHSIHAAVACQ